MAREGKKTSPDASTFRIDLPETLRKAGTMYLQAPQHAYEARHGRSLSLGHSSIPERFPPPNREVGPSPYPSQTQSGPSPPLLQSYSSETASHIPHDNSNRTISPVPDIIHPPSAASGAPAARGVARAADCPLKNPEPPEFAIPSYSPLNNSQPHVDTRTYYPPEKVAQQLSPLQDVHPLERQNRYQVVESNPLLSLSYERNVHRRSDQQPPDEESTYHMMDEPSEEERRRSASRESRRAEIERGGNSAGKLKITEGIEVVPRIVRVETDGFGRFERD